MSDPRHLRARLAAAAGELLEVIGELIDEPPTPEPAGPSRVPGVSIAPGETAVAALCRATSIIDAVHRQPCEELEVDRCQTSDLDAPATASRHTPKPDGAAPVRIPGLEGWAGLLGFAPAGSLFDQLRDRGATPLGLADEVGPVNLDAFLVQVDRLPRGFDTPGALLRQLRDRADALIDPELGRLDMASNADRSRWRSPAPVGAILHIDGPEPRSLVCSEASATRLRLSAIASEQNPDSPLAGHREWSFVEIEGGGWLFCIRGAHRLTRDAGADDARQLIVRDNQLWRSLQRGFVCFINRSGGVARTERSLSSLYSWQDLAVSGYLAGRDDAPLAPIGPSCRARHLDVGALEVGDLVVITAGEPGRASTAGMYVGEGLIAERAGDALIARPITRTLAGATRAVAARREGLSVRQVSRLRDAVCDRVGERSSSTVAIRPGSFRVYRRRCLGPSPVIRVDLGRGRDDSFAIDQAIVDAFEAVRAPLVAPVATSNGYALEAPLSYLGHLIS